MAARALAAGAAGEVCAVFDSTAYLRLGSGTFVCIGGPALVAGPINVGCDAWPDTAEAVLRPGMVVLVTGARVQVGMSFAITTAMARRWQPQAYGVVGGAAIRRRLDRIRPAVGEQAPVQSLCRLILEGTPADPVARVAAPAVHALRGWLAQCVAAPEATVAEPASAIAGLLGLGPGLTPSGDDLLVGVLVALAAWRRHAAVAALGAFLDPRLALGTSEISAAHLRAAMQGEAVEPIHHCVAALTQDAGDPKACLAALDRYGHTSGWDALAGVLLVASVLSAR
jgi:hypothetical protein